MLDSNWDLICDLLESEIWIDKMTRAIFIEFVVANMNVNIFTQVKIVYGRAQSRAINYHIAFCTEGPQKWHQRAEFLGGFSR